MTWSSYPQHQLMVEGFRDFFKRKKKSSATYPASELTTIVNLISNLAKKLNIETNIRAIVKEFEAMLKSQKIDLQEQDDRLMIGADLELKLDDAPQLKKFIDDLEKESPQGVRLLVKALEKGAFNVSKKFQGAAQRASSADSPPTDPSNTTRAAQSDESPPPTPSDASSTTNPQAKKPKQDGLKSLSRAEINQALGPIKNFGKLDIQRVRQEIENNIAQQLKGNPFAREIKSEQLPNIKKILDQVEKILAGDFENLISESNSEKFINLISEEIIKAIK